MPLSFCLHVLFWFQLINKSDLKHLFVLKNTFQATNHITVFGSEKSVRNCLYSIFRLGLFFNNFYRLLFKKKQKTFDFYLFLAIIAIKLFVPFALAEGLGQSGHEPPATRTVSFSICNCPGYLAWSSPTPPFIDNMHSASTRTHSAPQSLELIKLYILYIQHSCI